MADSTGIGRTTGKLMKQALAASVVAAMSVSALAKDEVSCTIKDGDRWCFYGDSITAAAVYARVVERVFRHYHPEANVSFINNAQGGKKASVAKWTEAVKGDPTIVSIMLGMNDAINSPWIKGMPVEPVLDAYRADMTRLVRDLKADGREVILLTPTLTDETIGTGVFRLEGTAELLRQMGRVCTEVAAAEEVPCIPMQEEFEACQERQPLREQRFRVDGVHPTASGHYAMARILWTHLNLAAPLSTTPRVLAPPVAELPVTGALRERMLPIADGTVALRFATATPGPVRLTWSTPKARGNESLELGADTLWQPKLPADAYPEADGRATDLVVDLAAPDGRHALFFVDLYRNPVLHLKDGRVDGHIDTDTEREDGARVCDFSFRTSGKSLIFEAAVHDSQLVSAREANAWPWAGDSMTLFLDLRPTPRFGGLGLERDAYQLWFQPQETYGFTPGFRPWYGKGLENVATSFGGKTADGYTLGLALGGWFNLQERFDITAHDFIGFDLSVNDFDGPGNSHWYDYRKLQYPVYLYVNGMSVIDLKNKLPGDSVIVANIFPY